MYFGARHGKGPADGAVSHIKLAAKRAVKARQVVIKNAKDFADFCKSKFAHKTYDEKLQQHFIQEFFLIEVIERDDSEIVAVTSANTHSLYSVCSTGEICIVEVCEVSCCCQSCLYNDGTECPNKAYASQW